jgi:hypothetical protein
MKSVKYLEDVKAKFGLKNDRQLALHLNMGTNTISQYVHGKRVMDDESCIAVALQLGIHPMEIIGAACIDRAEKTGQKSLWEVFMTRTAATAASALVAAGVTIFLTMPSPAEARNLANNAEYKLCEIARRIKTMFARSKRMSVAATS